MAVTGTASFDLVNQTSNTYRWGSDNDWSHGTYTEAKGVIKIDAMTPAVFFPLGCTPGVNCTSQIPALFNGTGTMTVTSGGTTTTLGVSMGFESAYLNPFGGPIIFASSAGEIIVIAGYSQARIQWTDVQMGGTAAGTFGNAPVAGAFGMLVNSSEDLKSGTEWDQGAISFFGMSNPALNGAGTFFGFSMIPAASAIPCPGFPPGTCNVTGLQSNGLFSMTTASGASIVGRYSTSWTVPAVAFSSNISAWLTNSRHHRY